LPLNNEQEGKLFIENQLTLKDFWSFSKWNHDDSFSLLKNLLLKCPQALVHVTHVNRIKHNLLSVFFPKKKTFQSFYSWDEDEKSSLDAQHTEHIQKNFHQFYYVEILESFIWTCGTFGARPLLKKSMMMDVKREKAKLKCQKWNVIQPEGFIIKKRNARKFSYAFRLYFFGN
jgi:hypothetical protein